MTQGRDATILVVDDEADVADAYAAQLRERYDVKTAYSGEEALALLDSAIDVVLLDRRMPDISGDEVLAEIRDRNLGTRVAMVTAVDPGFDIIEMPFDDYVVKPVSRAELFETIERLNRYADYEKRLRECYSLTAKYAALESTKPPSVLEESREFEELKAEITEIRDELDDLTESFDAADFELLFKDFDTHESSAANER